MKNRLSYHSCGILIALVSLSGWTGGASAADKKDVFEGKVWVEKDEDKKITGVQLKGKENNYQVVIKGGKGKKGLDMAKALPNYNAQVKGKVKAKKRKNEDGEEEEVLWLSVKEFSLSLTGLVDVTHDKDYEHKVTGITINADGNRYKVDIAGAGIKLKSYAGKTVKILGRIKRTMKTIDGQRTYDDQISVREIIPEEEKKEEKVEEKGKKEEEKKEEPKKKAH